jgi:NTE family protein
VIASKGRAATAGAGAAGGAAAAVATAIAVRRRVRIRSGLMTLREWLSVSEFNLALSSSFFGFYAHLGVVTAILEAGFKPRKITGSSAGALVGAAVATGIELRRAREIFFSVQRQDFWDPSPGAGFLKGDKFRALLERHFAEDFSGLKIPFEAAVFDLFSLSTRFLNSGSLAAAVSASCAVPVMFHPVPIHGRLYYDGGLIDKTGINHKDRHRTLCIYLDSRWKRFQYVPRLAPDHKLLRLSNLPRPNPLKLEVGKLAYEAAFEKTKAAMDHNFAN